MTRRIVMSIIMGSIIGFERRRADRPAGIRTMAMVCLGACVFTLTSMFAFVDGTCVPSTDRRLPANARPTPVESTVSGRSDAHSPAALGHPLCTSGRPAIASARPTHAHLPMFVRSWQDGMGCLTCQCCGPVRRWLPRRGVHLEGDERYWRQSDPRGSWTDDSDIDMDGRGRRHSLRWRLVRPRSVHHEHW